MARETSAHCKRTGKGLRSAAGRSTKSRHGKELTTKCKNRANDWRKKGNYVDKTQPRNNGKWKKVRKSGRSTKGKHSGRPRNR